VVQPSLSLRISALVLGCLSSGCSLIFVNPPPSAPGPGMARPHVDCTSSYLWPIVDSALMAYQLAGVAYVATLDESRFANYPISKTQDMALGGVFAAAYAGSAIYGYVSAGRCRRIRHGPPAPDYLPGVSSADRARHSATSRFGRTSK
jgi:hypothetical protein